MIAPQELKLGNWVATNNSKQYLLIKNGKDIDAAASTCLPIPITADVLQKCGFAFHDYFKLWQKNKPVPGTGPEMELDQDFWVLDFSHHRIGVALTSLHQLQNLYFALKREELPVAAL